jgi:hypothetical protein
LLILVIVLDVHFCFIIGVNGREDILVVLCAIAWFEQKLIAVSMVVGLRNISISRCVDLRIINAEEVHTSVTFICGRNNVLCILFLLMVAGSIPDGVGFFH